MSIFLSELLFLWGVGFSFLLVMVIAIWTYIYIVGLAYKDIVILVMTLPYQDCIRGEVKLNS
jgi:hypothetical protein